MWDGLSRSPERYSSQLADRTLHATIATDKTKQRRSVVNIRPFHTQAPRSDLATSGEDDLVRRFVIGLFCALGSDYPLERICHSSPATQQQKCRRDISPGMHSDTNLFSEIEPKLTS